MMTNIDPALAAFGYLERHSDTRSLPACGKVSCPPFSLRRTNYSTLAGRITVINLPKYLKNRVAFPLDELAKHRGERVAWSPDGRRIVAAASDPGALDALDALICAAGDEPENCPIEGIPDADCVVGGMDAP